jgi:hypothetical protein
MRRAHPAQGDQQAAAGAEFARGLWEAGREPWAVDI